MSAQPTPADMTHADLLGEYEDLREEQLAGILDEDLIGRQAQLWHELRARTDVEQPECPECEARNWGFSDHTECLACGHGATDADLLDDIQRAWSQILSREVDE